MIRAETFPPKRPPPRTPPHPGVPTRPPRPQAPIGAAHDADITPDTIIPPWYGERLDLDNAIYVCFANARTEEQKQADCEQIQEPVFRPDTRGGDFSNTRLPDNSDEFGRPPPLYPREE